MAAAASSHRQPNPTTVTTQLDKLATLADQRWYTTVALRAKLRASSHSVSGALLRLAQQPGYTVEKRRAGKTVHFEYRITRTTR
jgi:hypothetical protein